MSRTDEIRSGKTLIGIEFGSTRIKAVLTGTDYVPLASGVHDWESRQEDGIWTYSMDAVREGLADCFADLMRNTQAQYGVQLTTAAGIGISAMMHGYLAFDAQDDLLVPFRTWRNTITGEAAEKLTAAFSYNIPQRWSIAHLYQAILNKEAHIPAVRYLNTLAGYVHYLLTGERVLGIGDASGMFPIDPKTGSYDAKMLGIFSELTADTPFRLPLADVLPRIVPVGECAGRLTAAGAKLLDPTGVFQPGVPLCPPEGDAQTGMAATNSVRPKTGNISAGTSVFAMVVLENPLKAVHREIDLVTTPSGDPVAMVHCNNCSSDFDAWVGVFGGLLESAGKPMKKGELYDLLYQLAAEGDPDCGGIVSYNYYAGEEITGTQSGCPMLLRGPSAAFHIRNLLRSLVYACFATLKIGMDILTEKEQVQLAQIYAHGGLFKTPVATQPALAAAIGADVTLMQSAGEGGAWGIALLASYMLREDRSESFADYLQNRVFADMQTQSVSPDPRITAGFEAYLAAYRSGLPAERAAAVHYSFLEA